MTTTEKINETNNYIELTKKFNSNKIIQVIKKRKYFFQIQHIKLSIKNIYNE